MLLVEFHPADVVEVEFLLFRCALTEQYLARVLRGQLHAAVRAVILLATVERPNSHHHLNIIGVAINHIFFFLSGFVSRVESIEILRLQTIMH